MKQSKNYLVCVLEDVFQSSQLQNITVFLCTLYKMKKFRFYPLSYAHDRVFFNSPRRSPKRKKLLKDRGVYADLIPALGAFRVKNQTYAATTTPHRSRIQSYDIHIFIDVLKHLSTCIVESVVTYHSHDYINRTRAHVLIYAITLASLQCIASCAPVPYVKRAACLPGTEQTTQKKDVHNVHTCIFYKSDNYIL